MMNRIVHEHLKASELPEKLRAGIDGSAIVTGTVQEETDVTSPSREVLRNLLEGDREPNGGVTTEAAVARVRALRDPLLDAVQHVVGTVRGARRDRLEVGHVGARVRLGLVD